jgi:hypothetical protein
MSTTTPGTTSLTRPRWTAIFFMVGSALFAVGVPLSLDTSLDPAIAAWVFFAGSIFFTTAGFLQLLTSRDELAPPPDTEHGPAWLANAFRPRTLDWTASAVQFVGTLAFNVTTLRGALDVADSATITPQLVWRPDAFGSILFLVASALAWLPEVRWRRHGHARTRSWAIGALNMLGSVFFGLSAIGAYTIPDTNELLSAWWSNIGTLLGALCFLAGAALLLPRRSDH